MIVAPTSACVSTHAATRDKNMSESYGALQYSTRTSMRPKVNDVTNFDADNADDMSLFSTDKLAYVMSNKEVMDRLGNCDMDGFAKDLYSEMVVPYRPLSAYELEKGAYRVCRQFALDFKMYLQPNGIIASMIVMDIDNKYGIACALQGMAGIEPNIIVHTKQNGHVHAVWYLREGVTMTSKGHIAPIQYLQSIKDGLARAVHGDPAYVGMLMHNPLNPRWHAIHVHDYLYTLDELNAGLRERGCMRAQQYKDSVMQSKQALLGRNCYLFAKLSSVTCRYARDIMDQCGSYNETMMHDWLMSDAQDINMSDQYSDAGLDNTMPLDAQEVQSIVASVSKHAYYTYSDKTKEDLDRELSERQKWRGMLGNRMSLWARQKDQREAEPIFEKLRRSMPNAGKKSLRRRFIEECKRLFSKSERTFRRWFKDFMEGKQLLKHMPKLSIQDARTLKLAARNKDEELYRSILDNAYTKACMDEPVPADEPDAHVQELVQTYVQDAHIQDIRANAYSKDMLRPVQANSAVQPTAHSYAYASSQSYATQSRPSTHSAYVMQTSDMGKCPKYKQYMQYVHTHGVSHTGIWAADEYTELAELLYTGEADIWRLEAWKEELALRHSIGIPDNIAPNDYFADMKQQA